MLHLTLRQRPGGMLLNMEWKMLHVSFEEMIQHRELDAVIICSPTDLHASQVIQAAEKGLDVFCEKPVDLKLEKVQEVLRAVDDAGVRLMIGFNRRFDPNFARVRKMMGRRKNRRTPTC